MADDPYAQIATPIDPYASIATPVDATPAASDRATTFGGGMIEGAKDLGQGLANLPQAVLHPADTIRSMVSQQRGLGARAVQDFKTGHYGNAAWHAVDAALPGLGPLDAQLTDEYQSGAPGAKSAAMGRTLVNALPSLATEGIRPAITKFAPKVAAGMNNAAIGADNTYGANAGRGMYNAGIVGGSAKVLLRKAGTAARDAAEAHNADLAKYGAGKQFSLRPAINEPFDSAIAAKTDPITGAVAPAQVAKARQVQATLNSPQSPATGRPLQVGLGPNGRDLTNYTALQANKLKSNIYGMTDYDDPFNNSLSNNALKGAASNIKRAIDTNVPQAIGSGQHLHDLMSAADALKGGNGLELSKGGMIDAGVKLGLTGGARALRVVANGANSITGRAASRIVPALAPRNELLDPSIDPQETLPQTNEQPASTQQEPVQQAPQGNGQANTQSDLENQQHDVQPSTTVDTAPTLKTLDRQTAEHYYDLAGGDPDAARALAAKDGYTIE